MTYTHANKAIEEIASQIVGDNVKPKNKRTAMIQEKVEELNFWINENKKKKNV